MGRPSAEREQSETLRFRTDLLSRLRTYRIALFYGNNMSDLIENRLFLHVQAEEDRLKMPNLDGKVSPKTPSYASYALLPTEVKTSVDTVTGLINRLLAGDSEEVVKAAFKKAFPDKKKSRKPRTTTKKLPVKSKRAHLTDKAWVSLDIYGDIPAGWADDRQSIEPKRTIKFPRSEFCPGMFGLDVTGDSMNAAKGKLGPIRPGETVLLVPFTTATDAAGKIIAANIDGRTTLKRMVCPKGKPCHLQPESNAPEFAGAMHPLDEITVLGVVVGKL